MIAHARRCPRPKPVTRRAWTGEPELFCHACGRSARQPDTTNEPRKDT